MTAGASGLRVRRYLPRSFVASTIYTLYHVAIGAVAGFWFSINPIAAALIALVPLAPAAANATVAFTTAPNLQRAVAYGLAKDDAYYAGLAGDLEAKRDRFADGLAKLGFGVAPCEGTYFITADAAPLRRNIDDVEFSRRMTVEAGVTPVPLSAFYESDSPRTFVRFCFSKKDDVLDAALDRLGKWLA